MKILVMLILGLLVSYTCFALFFLWPKSKEKKTYSVDFVQIKKMQKSAFDEKFVEKVLEKMKGIKLEKKEYVFNNGKIREYYFYENDFRTEMYSYYSVDKAIDVYEIEKKSADFQKTILYSYNSSDTRYYGTYMIQYRNTEDNGGTLKDEYAVEIGILNNNIFIKIIDFSKVTNKEKIQKYINMFGEAATKE